MGITQLAEWDRLPKVERDLRLAEHDRERTKCPDCGRPLTDCTDSARTWKPYRRICYVTMEREGAEAALRKLRGDNAKFHDGTFTSWAREWSPEHPYPAGAGETIGVAEENLAPWDEFTTKLEASPLPPSDVGVDGDDCDDHR